MVKRVLGSLTVDSDTTDLLSAWAAEINGAGDVAAQWQVVLRVAVAASLLRTLAAGQALEVIADTYDRAGGGSYAAQLRDIAGAIRELAAPKLRVGFRM